MPTIDVILKASAAGFSAGMSKAAASAGSFKNSLSGMTAKMAGFGAVLAGVAGAASITDLVNQQFDHIDALAKTADKLGITTEALAGLRHAADLSGAGADSMDKSLQRMIRNISNFAQATAPAENALTELGLNAQELSRMTPDKQFAAIADAMQGVGNHSDKVRLAFEIFGRDGVALINTMKGGSEALAGTIAEAEKLGIAVNRVDAAKIEAANDAWDRFKKVLTGIAGTIAVEVAPFLDAFSTKLVEVGTQGEGVSAQVSSGFSWMGETLAIVADGVDVVMMAFDFLRIGVNKTISLIVRGLAQLAKGVEAVGNMVGLGLGDSASTFLESFSDTLDQSVSEMRDELKEDFIGPSTGEKLTSLMDEVKRKSEAAALAVAAVPDGIEGEDLDAGPKPWEKFQDKADPGKAIREATQTPLEKFEAKMQELNDLASFGFIDEDVFSRAAQQAKEELESGLQIEATATDAPEALTRGSQAAFAAINRRMSGAMDPQEKSAKSLDELVKLARAQDQRDRQRSNATVAELATVTF